MKEKRVYSEGDWIVHSNYGMGKIKGSEVKAISGEEKHYFRVETTDSVYWMPKDQMDSEILRPLATPEEIQQAIAVLKKPPIEMSSNYKMRQNRIQETRTLNTPKAIALLIRDLRALKRAKGILNSSERGSFYALKQQLAEEWAIVTGVPPELITVKLDKLLELPQALSDGPNSVKTHQEPTLTKLPISTSPA